MGFIISNEGIVAAWQRHGVSGFINAVIEIAYLSIRDILEIKVQTKLTWIDRMNFCRQFGATRHTTVRTAISHFYG